MKKLSLLAFLALLTLSSFSQDPTFEWVKGVEILGINLSSSSCEDVAVDDQGNVISVGFFKGNIDFDTDPTFGVNTYLNSDGVQAGYIQKLDANGDLVWAVKIGGTTGLVRAFSLDLDNAGNVYCAGFFQSTVDFDPSASTAELTAGGNADAFILKLNSDGTFAWAKQIGGPNGDIASSVVLDASGNITLTGTFEGTADFDPTSGVSNLTSISYSDMFIAKLDAAGNLTWAKQIGSTTAGSGHEEPLKHTIDNNGNILVTGWFYLTMDFDPGPNILDLTNAGGADMFILKLSPNGDLVWVKQVGANSSAGTVLGLAIDTDAANNTYLTGKFTGNTDFDSGPGLAQLPANQDDTFILKLDANGDFVWVREIVGADDEVGYGISVESDGTSYVVGGFTGSADFDGSLNTFNLSAESSTSQDVYILKLDVDGDFVWAGDMGSRQVDYGKAIHIDDNGNIHAIGFYKDPGESYPEMDFDPGPAEATIFSPFQDPQGLFILKLAQNGNTVGVLNTEQQKEIRVYPNPSNESVRIALDDFENQQTLCVHSMNGKLIHKQEVEGFGALNYQLPEEKGIYLIQVIESNGQSSSVKVVKE